MSDHFPDPITVPSDFGQEEQVDVAPRFEELPGSQYFIPFRAIKATDKGRLLTKFRSLVPEDGADDGKLDLSEVDEDKLYDLIDFTVTKFTKDPVAFDAWSAEDGNFGPTLEVVMAFVSRVGESTGSAAK